MTCVLKTLPKSSHLGLILAVAIPVAVALAAIGLLVLICWRFGAGFARQWEAMRIARLKRRQVLMLSMCVAAAAPLTRQALAGCISTKTVLSNCCRQPPGTLKEGQGGLGLAPMEVSNTGQHRMPVTGSGKVTSSACTPRLPMRACPEIAQVTASLCAALGGWHAGQQACLLERHCCLVQVTMIMTDVEGSTELWEQDSAAADKAIALHDSILRGLLPSYYGFEVGGSDLPGRHAGAVHAAVDSMLLSLLLHVGACCAAALISSCAPCRATCQTAEVLSHGGVAAGQIVQTSTQVSVSK